MSAPRPQRRPSRLKWLLATLAALGVLYVTYYVRPGSKPAYPPHAFYEVKRGDLLISLVEDGALRALNETIIRSSLEGFNRIIQLAPEGSHVKKGDLLVEFDSSGLKDRLNEQELMHQERLFQYLQAQANLKIQKSLAESQIKDAELKLKNAEDDLEKYRDAEAPLLIKTVESRIDVLAEQVRIARERYERTQELFKAGNATKSELEADALTLKREELGLGQYQEDLRLIKKFDQPNQLRLLQANVEEARKELERLKQRTANEIAQAEADLKSSERTIELLEESIDLQRQRLANTKIHAPQDGLVVYAPVSQFQYFGDRGGREDNRSRGSRSGDSSREFRGGRRGGRSDGGSMSSSSLSSSASSSSAQTVSAANQRIASAISGTAETQGAASGQSGGGSVRSGGSGGGGDVQSATRAFVSYPSMRPSSMIPQANGTAGNETASGGTSRADTLGGSSLANNGSAPFSGNSQFGFRSSQSFQTFGLDMGTSGYIEEGIMVRQRQELIRLPDVSKMLAEIKIPEARVRQVRAGMTAYVRVENIPNRTFKGRVRRVALLPDAQMSWMNPENKVYATDILIEDELPDLKPGVSARAEVVITNLSNVLSVPIHTVVRHLGQNVCFVRRGSTAEPVPVTTGWFNDRFVEIVSGLKEGDQVLLAPVGDELTGVAAGETNEVESVEEAAPRLPEGAAVESDGEGRRMRRNAPDEPDAAPPTEGRRGRQGGRRSERSQEISE